MRVLSTKTINANRECYPEADGALKTWVALIEGNEFKHFPELKAVFGSADFVQPDRVVFNIKGNHYRLIVKVNYAYRIVWIRFIGTHAEYDKIDANTI